MRGCYKYAPAKVIVAKIVNQKQGRTTKQAEPNSSKYLQFIDGEDTQSNTTHLKLDALTAGEYLIIYSFGWTRLHPVRKTIFNLYYKQGTTKNGDIKLQKLDETLFGNEMYEQMSEQLQERIKDGASYRVQMEV